MDRAGNAPRAHPRSRGENQDENIVNLSKQGSSPLTRGKPMTPAARPALSGLIPAHAGKTPTAYPFWALARAHPRSRGENGVIFSPPSWWRGSSPLTRGKRSVANELDHTHGLIPAHAGKTRGSHTASMTAGAHPRSRGENIKAAVSVVVEWGSSPLTRGKRACFGGTRSQWGLIPAHAGKTGRDES